MDGTVNISSNQQSCRKYLVTGQNISQTDLPEDRTIKMELLNTVTYLAFGSLAIVRALHCFCKYETSACMNKLKMRAVALNFAIF